MTPEEIEQRRRAARVRGEPPPIFTIYEVPPSRYFWLRHRLCNGDVTRWGAVGRTNLFVALAFADFAQWEADMRAESGADPTSERL